MSSAPISLPRPTSNTVSGPKFQSDGEQFLVDYDYEDENGKIEWTRVVFDEVLFFEYRRDSLCAEDSITGPREVRCRSESQVITEMLGALRQSSIWLEWQQKRGGVGRFKHFTIFFDDAACVNVIAASCTVGSVESSPD